ncbi:MAG: hypothetical protein QOE87_1756 [Gaiellales bacterium]|jgi:hypothetical protein|nr:hypothetical protein [Gaiellales bacterium]
MSWTVACFCGNVYTAPPARCDLCGRTLSRAVTDEPSAIVSIPCGFEETAGGTQAPPWPTGATPGRKRADA